MIIVSLVVAMTVFAGQKDGSEVLSKMSSKIESLGDYRVMFVADVEGYVIEGLYIVSGDKYYIVVGTHLEEEGGVDYEIVCDGKVRYQIDYNNQEVLIDKINPNERVIFNNPTRAFDFAAKDFKSYYTGSKISERREVEMISLLPLDEDTTLSGIYLTVDSESALPVELRYSMDGLDSEVVVKIHRVEKAEDVDVALFEFTRKNYPDFEVVDFR